jgi:tetratricopeptide (TPR) repeat protein
VAVVTFVVFLPALWNGFVEWDDYVNILENPRYRGLGPDQLRWMFTTTLMGHYIPLTWLTFGLDYVVWGMNPLGYHLTNNLLHAANAFLVALLALRLLAKATALAGRPLTIAAGVAALFFALHPLRAESVAWATERRDVLSGLFFLLSILVYLRAGEAARHRRWLLAAAAGAYALALASKSIVMTLPAVLVLLDIYPLRRLRPGRGMWRDPAARAVLVEKLPFVALSLAGAVASYAVLAANAYVTPLARYPWPARIGMAFHSLWFYLAKTVLPVNLSPLYELPAAVNPLDRPFLASAFAVVTLTVTFWLLRRRWPAGLAVWVYYGIVLAPVTGIVHAGHQLTHDRYSYLSCLGWALLVGAGAGVVVRAWAAGTIRPAVARAAAAGVALLFLGLGALTWSQVQVWRDTDTLWRYAIEADPSCSICQNNLGVHLSRRGYPALAKERFQRTLALRPDRVKSYDSLALAHAAVGERDEAIAYLRRMLEHEPGDVDALNNLGVVLITMGKPSEAVATLERGARIDGDHVAIRTNLALALLDLGRPAEALPHALRAATLRSETPQPRFALARTYLALGDRERARPEYDAVLRLEPRLAGLLGPFASSEP